MRELWHQYRDNKAQQKRIKKWVDEFGGALKQLAAGADKFALDGQVVATLVYGQLNETLLAKEQPAIVAEYTRKMTVERFDKEAFRNEMPDMYRQYQAQRLVLTGESE